MTNEEAIAEMVAALETISAEIPELQVTGYWNPNPTPPSIDIYPGDPSQEGAGFGVRERRTFWTVRARTSVTDPQAGTKVLLQLMDPEHPASIEAALARDDVAVISNQGSVGGFGTFGDDQDGLLGVLFTVEKFL